MSNKLKVSKAKVAGAKPKYPGAKRYTLPKNCSIESFVMRKLTSRDDLEVATIADAITPNSIKERAVIAAMTEQREAVRYALVEVNGERVNHDGVPYAEMDQWDIRTMRFVNTAFADLNGTEKAELEDFMIGAALAEESENESEPQEDEDSTVGPSDD